MPSSGSGSPTDETYFNNLSQQPCDGNDLGNPDDCGNLTKDGRTLPGDNDAQARTKRIACVLCRKRKLRCDGARPACGTCKRLTHDCAYDEIRKKSGPKRGYVKLLEARLQQVETLLKNQDPMSDMSRRAAEKERRPSAFPISAQGIPSISPALDGIRPAPGQTQTQQHGNIPLLPLPLDRDAKSPGIQEFPWEMIGLGLEEPLPLQDTINDLHRIYFEKIHPSIPIIHRPRYLAAMNLAPQMRPPVGLRYMMWCTAASVTDKYAEMTEHFYYRARKYLQMDEMKGHGESMITVGVCQAWLLVALHEFKLMYFPRAWLSVGRAVRLAQMMGLHRLDGASLDVKQCVLPPRDWTESEERRRTFWMAFCCDRYASIGTGWPMIVDERDINTNMPASEEAFDKSRPEQTSTLAETVQPGGAARLTPLGGVVLMACLFGRNLTHLHRPTPEDQEDNLAGAFWQRHREMESILATTGLSLPGHLRLPAGLPDVNVIFLNMNLHTSAICLHQAAIFKADRFKLPASVGSDSRIRCMTAAAEIARIMKMLVHLDLSSMNPFVSFCLYVAARVFVQYLKFRPKDQQMISSLQFLLAAMQTLKIKNPLTESFIVQLDLDLAGAGIDVGQGKAPPYKTSRMMAEPPLPADNVSCSAFPFEARDPSQQGVMQVPDGSLDDMSSFHGYSFAPPIQGGFVSSSTGMNDQYGQAHATDATVNSQLYMAPPTMLDLPHRNSRGLTPNRTATVTSLSPTSPDMDYSELNNNNGNNNINGHNDTTSPSTNASRQNSTSHTNYTSPDSVDNANTYQTFNPLSSNTTSSTDHTNMSYNNTSASTVASAPSVSPSDPINYYSLPQQLNFNANQLHPSFSLPSEPNSAVSLDQRPIGAGGSGGGGQADESGTMGDSGGGDGGGSNGGGGGGAGGSGNDYPFVGMSQGWDTMMGGTGPGQGLATGLTPVGERSWGSMMEGWEGLVVQGGVPSGVPGLL